MLKLQNKAISQQIDILFDKQYLTSLFILFNCSCVVDVIKSFLIAVVQVSSDVCPRCPPNKLHQLHDAPICDPIGFLVN